MCKKRIEDLLEEGYTKKFADNYLKTVKVESQSSCYEHNYTEWAHSHGFYAESAYAYGLTEENLYKYLSDYDYYKIWPINAWTRIWVNDKLTLKYMLANSLYNDIMPDYYYYSTPNGLKSLIDNPYQDGSFENFLSLLQEKGEFACKPCNGTTAIGFVRLSFDNSKLYANKTEISEEELREFVKSHPNYVFTEYIRPNKQFAKYSPQIHTLRVVTLNETGENPRIIGGYLRIPNKYNGDANYTVLDGTNAGGAFNLFVEVNMETGEYGNAKKIFVNHIENTLVHPDTGEKICGIIENFNNLRETVLGIARRFNTLEFLGFDIGVTDKGFKCMEINTHPGIKYMQIFKPLLEGNTKDYFQKKIKEIDDLSTEMKKNRNNIIR